MKRGILIILAILLFSACGEHALKEPREDAFEHSFEYYAPNARRVYLSGEFVNWKDNELLMNKSEDGWWTTTLYLDEGRWQYKFVVDGVWTHDTNNPVKFDDGFGGYNSILILGEVADDMMARPDTAKGILSNITLAEHERSENFELNHFNLYLPPGYAASTEAYPVLYMLHGLGSDEHQWTDLGLIQNYMDNYIADGKIEPFIIVMPSGDRTFYTNEVQYFITEDIPEYLNQNFRIKQGTDHTAISGMSMGGIGSFYIAQRNPDIFGLCVPLSGYFDPGYLRDFKREGMSFTAELHIYCGTEDELCYDTNLELLKVLDHIDKDYEWTQASGGHTWRYWQGLMPELLPLISDYFYSD